MLSACALCMSHTHLLTFLHCAFVLLADCIVMLHECKLVLLNIVLCFEFLSLSGNCYDKLCSLLVA